MSKKINQNEIIDKVVIYKLESIQEMVQVRKLESEIWGCEELLPTHQTITTVKNGGLVLGAYLEDQLIGFQYSFPGYDGKNVYLCSHMLGIKQAFRNKGIGKLLKIAQRENALKLGFKLITWTYDPLETANGYLNISKLGGTCNVYLENCYGKMEDLLNREIASDRFLVRWDIINQDEKKLDLQEINWKMVIKNSLIRCKMNNEGHPIPILTQLNLETDIIYVAVPNNFRSIKKKNIILAREWRKLTRKLFIELFAAGWEVVDFYSYRSSDLPLHFYVLKNNFKKGSFQNEN